MQLKNKTLGLTALAILASAGQALAVNFAGSTTGIFTNPIGGTNNVGVGTNSFTWGVAEPTVSNLTFTGLAFSFDIPGPGTIGTLDYSNGSSQVGSGATGVTLDVTLTITAPGNEVFILDYALGLINTKNVADEDASADIVQLPAIAPKSFILDGYKYTLTLGFGNFGGESFGDEDEFKVHEGDTASADILATVTRSKVPESGSSLALLGGGMLLVSGLRRKLKAQK